MSKPLKIALFGNPNAGKSSIFNLLSGLRQKIGNYPGITVDRKTAKVKGDGGKEIFLTDLPGAYSLYSTSEDERIASDALLDKNHPDHPDKVIFVADATSLTRGLMACTQVMDLGIPVVLALNMWDMVEARKLNLDFRKLSSMLGLPVVPVSALKNSGMKELWNTAIDHDQPSKTFFRIPPSFAPMIAPLKEKSPGNTDYHAWVEWIQQESKSSQANDLKTNEITTRLENIREVLLECQQENQKGIPSLTRKLDKIFLHPIWGYVVFIFILALVFQAIFSWAQYPMNGIEWLFSKAGQVMHANLPDNFLTTLLVDGVWSGLGGIVIFVPQIAFLFMFISILEDSGYMSRMVFLMDRVMRPFGFSGKSVIPLIGGMACAVPSVMMARNIPNKKERLITIMVIPLMSCSARIPVYVLLIGLFVPSIYIAGIFNLQGLVMAAMYLLGFLMALAVAWVMKKAMKAEKGASFITELPVYRSPRWKNVGIVMFNKSKTFVTQAGKVIIVISLLLTVLSSFGPGDTFGKVESKYAEEKKKFASDSTVLDSLDLLIAGEKLETSYAGMLGRTIEPAIRPLGYDWKIGISLITSFAAREVFVGTMATLYHTQEGEGNQFQKLKQKMLAEKNPRTGQPVYTIPVAISLLVFYAFAMQCMSTLAVVKRETGSWKMAMVMLLYLTALAYVSALVVYQVLNAVMG